MKTFMRNKWATDKIGWQSAARTSVLMLSSSICFIMQVIMAQSCARARASLTWYEVVAALARSLELPNDESDYVYAQS